MSASPGSRPDLPTAAQLAQVPCCHRETIPYDYIDAYGHMNVRYYFDLWGKSAEGFMMHIGAPFHTMLERGYGNWVLRQVVDYLAEVGEGDTVAVYGRLVGFGPKRLHNKYWMYNETRGTIAASSEVLVTCANLKARRTALWPDDMIVNIEKGFDAFSTLDWEVPVSGAIHV